MRPECRVGGEVRWGQTTSDLSESTMQGLLSIHISIRQAGRQAGRHTARDKDGEIERDRYSETYRQRDIHTDRQRQRDRE